MVLLCSCCSCGSSCTCAEPKNESKLEESSLCESALEESIADLISTKKVIVTIDKKAYAWDEYVSVEFHAENEGEGFKLASAPDASFVEYWDGTSWKICKTEFYVLEYGIESSYKSGLLDGCVPQPFQLSDRAIEGKEKYRVGFHFTCGTFYSEEFTIIE
jgi:hypothetical protein